MWSTAARDDHLSRISGMRLVFDRRIPRSDPCPEYVAHVLSVLNSNTLPCLHPPCCLCHVTAGESTGTRVNGTSPTSGPHPTRNEAYIHNSYASSWGFRETLFEHVCSFCPRSCGVKCPSSPFPTRTSKSAAGTGRQGANIAAESRR